MTIRFICERCRHPLDVDDHLAGKHGHCKHCGHSLTVPAIEESEAGSPLRLRPLDGHEPGEGHDLDHAPGPSLRLRPGGDEPVVKLEGISAPPPTKPRAAAHQDRDYLVLDTEGRDRVGPPRSPIPRTVFLLRLARFVSGQLRSLRNWLYVASVLFLVLALCGYLYQVKALLHLGALGVVATNIGMLVVGFAYLVSLPFKEGPLYGLANLLIPFYAVYYWATRWPRMRGPVFRTLGSFVPILLVGLVYLVYEEAPVVEKAIEREVPTIEKKLDEALPRLERNVQEALPLPTPKR